MVENTLVKIQIVTKNYLSNRKENKESLIIIRNIFSLLFHFIQKITNNYKTKLTTTGHQMTGGNEKPYY